jgi:hypothetical protein
MSHDGGGGHSGGGHSGGGGHGGGGHHGGFSGHHHHHSAGGDWSQYGWEQRGGMSGFRVAYFVGFTFLAVAGMVVALLSVILTR